MMPLVFESVDTVTQAEFFAWVEERAAQGDINHYELLNGRIVMTPPAGWPHGGVEAPLASTIYQHVASARVGMVFGSSQGFDLPSGDTVEPDHSYVSWDRWRAAPAPEPGKFLRVVPDLVVEILSGKTASRDRGEKKAIYERNGVREYWVVDPRARRFVRFVLRDGRFDAGRAFEEGEEFESEILGGLRFPVAEIFPR